MTETQKKKPPTKWILILIAVVLIVAVIGVSLNSLLTKELTIASFKKEVSDSVSSYLSLTIENYWVSGNTVWSKGTVYYMDRKDTK